MIRAFVFAACALLLAGCVWSRLLDFKSQLKEFDSYFTPADEGDALLLHCKEPCTRPQDFGYLLGSEDPTSRSTPTADGTDIWTYHLKRDRADSVGIDISMSCKDGMTTALRIPVEVLRFLPRDRFLAMARAMGQAEIDKDKRQASTGLTGPDAKPIAPGRAKVLQALGDPDSVVQVEGGEELVYVFKLQAADGTPGPVTELKLTMSGEQMTAIRVLAPNFNAWLKLGELP
jgi:hypothetical protein